MVLEKGQGLSLGLGKEADKTQGKSQALGEPLMFEAGRDSSGVWRMYLDAYQKEEGVKKLLTK